MTKPIQTSLYDDPLTNAFPGLKINPDTKSPGYIGTLQLTDTNGAVIDEYTIKIINSRGPGQRFPAVFEIGGRLPHNMDWHVYEGSGQCCLFHEYDETLLLAKGYTQVEFIEKLVKPYFFNQTHRRVHGYYLHERPHSKLIAGMLVLQEICHAQYSNEIIAILRFMLDKGNPGKSGEIYAETGIKFSHTFEKIFSILKIYESDILYKMLSDARLYKQKYGYLIHS